MYSRKPDLLLSEIGKARLQPTFDVKRDLTVTLASKKPICF